MFSPAPTSDVVSNFTALIKDTIIKKAFEQDEVQAYFKKMVLNTFRENEFLIL